MKRQICIGLVLSATLVVLGMRSGLAQESQYNEDWAVISANTTSPASAPWFIDTVDSVRDVGRHVSVAIDPGSGMTFISYYNKAEGGCLYLARHVGSGGNCGPNHTWNCQLLDSFGSVDSTTLSRPTHLAMASRSSSAITISPSVRSSTSTATPSPPLSVGPSTPLTAEALAVATTRGCIPR